MIDSLATHDFAQPGRTEARHDGMEADAFMPALRYANTSVFTPNEAQALQREWEDIQASFIDQPARAVADADRLLHATMTQLLRNFARENARLDSRATLSTEDLRIALQRYRGLFDRLLAI